MAKDVACKIRFVLETDDLNIGSLMQTFMPNGRYSLNSAKWRGRKPRTCAVTHFETGTMEGNTEPGNAPIFIEVTYRPDGHITYVGETQYDGWRAMVPKCNAEGEFLDKNGDPLGEGIPPILEPRDIYGEMDFTEIDFGRLLEEVETEQIVHRSYEDVFKQAMTGGKFSISSGKSEFIVPRRSRPQSKVVLSNEPTGTFQDAFGTRILNINTDSPNLDRILIETLTGLMKDFVEGRVSLPTISSSSGTFVELSKSVVDCGPCKDGLDPMFDILHFHTPKELLEDIGKRLTALYEIEVEVIDGENCGILLRSQSS